MSGLEKGTKTDDISLNTQEERKTSPQIEIRDLTKIYSIPGGSVTALDHINLSIDKGDIYGIIGMSGAGKSTLVRCLNRLDMPTEGQVFIDGENILAMNQKDLRLARKRIAMIFQQFNLLMQKTVARNVRYPLEIKGIPKAEANKKVMELLKIVGLEEKANTYPAMLSGGQRQRVAIARALASDPEMILCDEATSALDPMTTQNILKLLQSINQEMGITVVLITHEMAVIRQVCNKVAILDNGKLVETGTVDEVFMHTKSQAGKRLFGIVSETEAIPQRSAIRITFNGEQADKPIISRLSREGSIDINILSANLNSLNNKSYGQMIIAKPDDIYEAQFIIDSLKEAGINAEEVKA